MVIAFNCRCGRQLKAKEVDAGKSVTSSDCGQILRIPTPTSAVVINVESPARARNVEETLRKEPGLLTDRSIIKMEPPPMESVHSGDIWGPFIEGGTTLALCTSIFAVIFAVIGGVLGY